MTTTWNNTSNTMTNNSLNATHDIQTASFVKGTLSGSTSLQTQHRRPTCREILDTYVHSLRPTPRFQGNCNHTPRTGAKLMDHGVGMWSLFGCMRYYVFNHRRHLPIRRHICLKEMLNRPKDVTFEFPQPLMPYPPSQRSGALIGP